MTHGLTSCLHASLLTRTALHSLQQAISTLLSLHAVSIFAVSSHHGGQGLARGAPPAHGTKASLVLSPVSLFCAFRGQLLVWQLKLLIVQGLIGTCSMASTVRMSIPC